VGDKKLVSDAESNLILILH